MNTAMTSRASFDFSMSLAFGKLLISSCFRKWEVADFIPVKFVPKSTDIYE